MTSPNAIGGSTLQTFIAGQSNPWFQQGLLARFGFGIVFALGYAVLAYDLLMLGKRRPVAATVVLITPLGVPWKMLVAFSCLAYFGIPPVTWRYLESTHHHPKRIGHGAESP